MQENVEELKNRIALYEHLLLEEHREREQIAGLFHGKKSALSVVILILSRLQGTANKTAETDALNETIRIQSIALDELYSVYIDIFPPVQKLAGLNNAFPHSKKRGNLWPDIQVSSEQMPIPDITISDYLHALVFKVCLGWFAYFKALGHSALDFHSSFDDPKQITLVVAATEKNGILQNQSYIDYKRNTLEAWMLLCRVKIGVQTNWKDIAVFTFPLGDENERYQRAQRHTRDGIKKQDK